MTQNSENRDRARVLKPSLLPHTVSPPASGPVVDVRFLLGETRPAPPVMRVVASLYGRLLAAIEGLPGSAWLTRDHFLFFALSAVFLTLLMPRPVATILYSIERFALRMPVSKLTLSGWPSLPTLLLPFVAVGLMMFFAGPGARLKALLIFSLAGGFAVGYLDAPSLLMLAAFGALCFAAIRLPISRFAAALRRDSPLRLAAGQDLAL